MSSPTPRNSAPAAVAVVLAMMAAAPPAPAQSQGGEQIEEMVVTGTQQEAPVEKVDVFGFGESLLETPRSASTISTEQLSRFNITDIDELVAFAPGTFTQSFFGVAGILDVRGTPGEVYFRGMRRLDNSGNYPTPIGAAQRLDIVRGPASPIMGPAKIGGYLNFNPKSPRHDTGEIIRETTGVLSAETGSWDRKVLVGELGGRISERAGYYLYGEAEDSGSFYDNTDTEQSVLQAAFDMDLSETVRVEFGGMYHDYTSNQVAGWNRLTQALVDHGTYITGTAKPLDANDDGLISHQEYCGDPAGTAESCGENRVVNPFFADPTEVEASDLDPQLALENTGTTKLDESNVLVAPEDTLENEVITLYFDMSYEGGDWKLTNKLFYEAYENLNENAYGFSQYHDTWVVEDKLILAFERDIGGVDASFQLSPSVRYTDFDHGIDYANEYFDRRDLSIPTAQRDASLDRRLLATTIDDDYTELYFGDYLDLGLAMLLNLESNGLSVTVGLREDWIEAESATDPNKLLYGTGMVGVLSRTKDEDKLFSWSVSVDWKTPMGLAPYVTLSEQATVIAGQGAELQTGSVAGGTWTDTSELREVGIKGSFLDDSLYFSLALFEQERTDFSAQAIVTNSADLSKGVEAELRWDATRNLLVTAGWGFIEVENLDAQANDHRRFSFLGAGDLPNLSDPALAYGGTLGGLPKSRDNSRRAGIPENIYTLTATYTLDWGLSLTGSIVDVDSAPSGFSQSVTLPAYTLVNAGITYETSTWLVQVNGKNLTDERYFRSNFPNLFGSAIALPELPRNYQARVAWKF